MAVERPEITNLLAVAGLTTIVELTDPDALVSVIVCEPAVSSVTVKLATPSLFVLNV